MLKWLAVVCWVQCVVNAVYFQYGDRQALMDRLDDDIEEVAVSKNVYSVYIRINQPAQCKIKMNEEYYGADSIADIQRLTEIAERMHVNVSMKAMSNIYFILPKGFYEIHADFELNTMHVFSLKRSNELFLSEIGIPKLADQYVVAHRSQVQAQPSSLPKDIERESLALATSATVSPSFPASSVYNWTVKDKRKMCNFHREFTRLSEQHAEAAALYQIKEKHLFYPNVGVGAAATLFSFIAALGADGHGIVPAEYTHLLVGVLTAVTSAFTIVQQQFGHASMAARHTAISNEYFLLSQHIRWNVNYPSRAIQEFAALIKTRVLQLVEANKDILLPSEVDQLYSIEDKEELGSEQHCVDVTALEHNHAAVTHHTLVRDDLKRWSVPSVWKLIEKRLAQQYGNNAVFQCLHEFCKEYFNELQHSVFQCILDDIDENDHTEMTSSRILEYMEVHLVWQPDQVLQFVNLFRSIIAKKPLQRILSPPLHNQYGNKTTSHRAPY